MDNYITVFTPTYNRRHMIGTLYDSLKSQTYQNFEWVVVDDGSADRTDELFENWIHNGSHRFRIKYEKTENFGKCHAINVGLEMAEGNVFFVMDSDDYLTPDALEKVNCWFNEIADRPEICGVAANKGLSETKTPNHIFSEEYLDKSPLEIYSYRKGGKRQLTGERALIFYTDYHRKYKYPIFENEKFMTEAVVWNRMAHDGCILRFYNDIICIYEYQDDGLTKAGAKLFINNPMGYGLWISERMRFENRSFSYRMKQIYKFTCDLENYYPSGKIAKAIQTNPCLISLFKIVHYFRQLHRRQNGQHS